MFLLIKQYLKMNLLIFPFLFFCDVSVDILEFNELSTLILFDVSFDNDVSKSNKSEFRLSKYDSNV